MESQLVRQSRPGTGARKPAPAGKLDTRELVALFQAGDYAQVEQQARAQLGRHPQSGFLWKALGAALQIQGKDALHALRQAAVILSGDAEAHSNLGGALREAGQLDAALQSVKRALRLNPGLADAHCNQGITLLDLGRTDDAIASLSRAVKIKPAHSLAWNNLGNALQGKWRFAEAVDCYHRALALAPNYAEAHNNLGKALRDLLRPDAALASYRRALELKPGYVEAQCNQAVLLQEMGQFEAALAGFRRTLAMRPGYAEGYFNQARVLRLLGRMDEAEASCRAAQKANPGMTGALVLASEFHADRGAFDLAEQALRDAIAQDPKQTDAWSGIPYLRKMTPADANWFASAQALASQGLPPREEAGLRYALGKYCDDVGDYTAAFPHYRRANELDQAARAPYRPEQESQAVDHIVRTCNTAWLQRRRPGASTSNRPVFIVGMPRSGTSLTEQILASHPAVHGAGELSFWQAAGIERALQDGEPGDAAIAEIAQAYLAVLDDASANAQRVVDKMPANYRHLGVIHAAFPNARFLHVRRNPLDTCLSIYFQRFNVTHAYANDLQDLAHHYKSYESLMAHWRAVLPPGAMLEVPYEGLVQDHEGWSRKMIDFLGLPWNDACLRFHENARPVTTFSNWQVRQKISKSSVERWRHYEADVGPLLQLLR